MNVTKMGTSWKRGESEPRTLQKKKKKKERWTPSWGGVQWGGKGQRPDGFSKGPNNEKKKRGGGKGGGVHEPMGTKGERTPGQR